MEAWFTSPDLPRDSILDSGLRLHSIASMRKDVATYTKTLGIGSGINFDGIFDGPYEALPKSTDSH